MESAWESTLTGTMDINRGPGYRRTGDPEMAVGSSPAWTSPGPWVATSPLSPLLTAFTVAPCGHQGSAIWPLLTVFIFFLSASFRRAWIISCLYLSRLPTTYLLIIIRNMLGRPWLSSDRWSLEDLSCLDPDWAEWHRTGVPLCILKTGSTICFPIYLTGLFL